jgi:pimeloyl-ACP methyl ester carboxylesterase
MSSVSQPIPKRTLNRIRLPTGVTISYDKYGSGPPLVLVHGSFSDHDTNWEFVRPMLEERFTVYAIARRGRGETDATEGHRVEDEANDVASVIGAAGGPVFLLGHSYGAVCSALTAAGAPDRIKKLVLYEPPSPLVITPKALEPLEELASAGRWEDFALTFFRDVLQVPAADIEAIRGTEIWPPIVSDAKASL